MKTLEQKLNSLESESFEMSFIIQALRKAIKQRDSIILSSDYYSDDDTENFNQELLEILEGK